MTVLDTFNLKGQVAVVTGSGRGIGEAIAIGLAEAGAKIVLAARRTEEIEAVAEKIKNLGGEAIAVTTDVMIVEQINRLADTAVSSFGSLDCWVSNAGGADDRVARTLLDVPERQWDFQLNLNLKAVWTGAQAAAKVMKNSGGGTIINISSAAAGRASPFNGPYAVAKSGVDSLTQTLSSELARYNIRVNGISPGPIPTEVFKEFLNITDEDVPEMGKKLGIPLGRLGTPEDIAPAAVFLASDASRWMTGETITIKGGHSR
ncbi:MAG: SDR family oxidoreductase [Pseudomonadales bacterium]|jgi:7-alpha-hydroxysteroid dehydrogenase